MMSLKMSSDTLGEDRVRKVENGAPDHVEAGTKHEPDGLLYDPHGMLLIPQPTDRIDDPLVQTPFEGAYIRHGENTKS